MILKQGTRMAYTAIVLAIGLQSCMADLRNGYIKKEAYTPTDEEKGLQLLKDAAAAQGLDQMKDHQVYSFSATDHWKGLLGRVGKLWPEHNQKAHFKYAIGTFDGQVTLADGKEQGLTSGLQSWKYYEQPEGGDREFVEYNKRTVFGLAAYQYFFEMTNRLQEASIVTYAGEEEFNGRLYDLVFCTWEKTDPHMEHDQYMVYVSKESGMVEYSVFTLRDSYLKAPGYKILYGSIHFHDFRDVDGVKIPFQQSIFSLEPNKKDKKYLHRLTLDSFEFDGFDVKELYPDPDLESVGDSKEGLGS